DPEVVAEIHSAAADPRRAARLAERLTAASGALDRERFDDARRMVAPVVKELPFLAAGHEVNGLAAYRLGLWRNAAQSLELARQIRVDPAILPVLADCYRALEKWDRVDDLWAELREASPSAELVTEGRIVAAGALADRGELRPAIALLGAHGWRVPKQPREHHLRRAYALADLYERAGDLPHARELFSRVQRADPGFGDVAGRLESL
ncbi:MAG: hypothetical protein KDB10_09855, partial [Acidimicrobiales bacterium]|nr:hypothetical protein [Acidimicrobiales bacterium]